MKRSRRSTAPSVVQISGPIVRTQLAGRVVFTDKAQPAPEPIRRPSKLAITLSIAHYLEEQIENGRIENRADIARRLGLSRARVTQILTLRWLAPDLQAEILFTEAVDGIEPFSQRVAREVARILAWPEQRVAWRKATGRTPPGT